MLQAYSKDVLSESWNNIYAMENKNKQDTYLQTLIKTNNIYQGGKCGTTSSIVDNLEADDGYYYHSTPESETLRIYLLLF